MLTSIVLSVLIQLCCVVNGSLQEYDETQAPQRPDNGLFGRLKDAYNNVIQKSTTKAPKEKIDYTTLETLNKFLDIQYGRFLNNKSDWPEQGMTLPEWSYEDDTAVDSIFVTQDPILQRINPDLARQDQLEAERNRRLHRIAKQEEISLRNYYKSNPTPPVNRQTPWKKSSEESTEPNEEMPGFLGMIGNKVMGGVFNTFQKTFLKAAQSAMGKEDVNIGDALKEDIGIRAKKARNMVTADDGHKEVKAKQVGDSVAAGLGTVKDKMVQGMSKVAGMVGRKLGKWFANYSHGRHPTAD